MVVLIVALVLPMNIYTNDKVAGVWSVGRTPVAAAEDFFARLFSSLPTKKDQPGRFFGNWLPFIGPISFGGEPVAWATTDYPSYWLSQTYNYYTSKGWVATETEHLEIGPKSCLPQGGQSEACAQEPGDAAGVCFRQVPDRWQLRLGEQTGDGGVAGAQAVQHRSGRRYRRCRPAVRCPGAGGANQDERSGLTPQDAESTVASILPNDLLIVEVKSGSSASTESITLQRKAPTTPELVAWNFSSLAGEHEPYRMTSYVSVATNEELREAPTDYGSFITDHYLQLPASLPDRIGYLADRLTAASATPLDKALAIQNYLRGPDFTYAQDIDAPPPNQDGVDWFLFETKTGYSDYFGSAMTVLLRSGGVPARLAAGYAPVN